MKKHCVEIIGKGNKIIRDMVEGYYSLYNVIDEDNDIDEVYTVVYDKDGCFVGVENNKNVNLENMDRVKDLIDMDDVGSIGDAHIVIEFRVENGFVLTRDITETYGCKTIKLGVWEYADVDGNYMVQTVCGGEKKSFESKREAYDYLNGKWMSIPDIVVDALEDKKFSLAKKHLKEFSEYYYEMFKNKTFNTKVVYDFSEEVKELYPVINRRLNSYEYEYVSIVLRHMVMSYIRHESLMAV